MSTAQSFVCELCELLGVPAPHPTADQSYMFERPITFRHGDGSSSPGRIDCYRHGHFVLEAKKVKAASHTKGFDDALLRARAQAEGYARALPRCFETFPFPDEDTGLSPALRERIAALAEQIDAHRKRQQAAHPGLTLTGMYNALVALKEGRELTAKEKTIHAQGLVGVLKELHDELDAAVLQAYGLDYGLEPGLSTDALLTHLVALNAQRALEEKAGHVRWLRPEFQSPSTQAATSLLLNQEQSGHNLPGLQADLALNLPIQTVSQSASTAQPWPGTLPEQVRAVAQLLASANAALSLAAIEARFKGKGPWKKGLPRIL